MAQYEVTAKGPAVTSTSHVQIEDTWTVTVEAENAASACEAAAERIRAKALGGNKLDGPQKLDNDFVLK